MIKRKYWYQSELNSKDDIKWMRLKQVFSNHMWSLDACLLILDKHLFLNIMSDILLTIFMDIIILQYFLLLSLSLSLSHTYTLTYVHTYIHTHKNTPSLLFSLTWSHFCLLTRPKYSPKSYFITQLPLPLFLTCYSFCLCSLLATFAHFGSSHSHLSPSQFANK